MGYRFLPLKLEDAPSYNHRLQEAISGERLVALRRSVPILSEADRAELARISSVTANESICVGDLVLDTLVVIE